MVNARWCIRRIQAACAAHLNLSIELNKNSPHSNQIQEQALLYQALADSRGTEIMARYEDRQNRIFDRSYRLLAKHRGKHGALPTTADLQQAESTLPAPSKPLKPEPDIKNRTFEPEPPEKPHRSLEPTDYQRLKPIFDILEDEPQLRQVVANAIFQFRQRQKTDLAA
jgi:hypothetical protein